MCNLYNVTTSHEAMRQFADVVADLTNRLDPALDVYPDRQAPIIRNAPEGRELALATWGMLTPLSILAGKPDSGVTNIRNVGFLTGAAGLSPRTDAWCHGRGFPNGKTRSRKVLCTGSP